ncbi:acyl-[acyl-carrier-protein] thioesterase [Levilactobacillus tangyuanensis]|uniref:Acyl-[acyl-carrier-protein] thioesterase n=1 Tax=Levilactobacillus tangyuanensis TaxID=2486021 RepID=A0ABW1TPD3_9LACO|nr:acyl-ACP thioesterase domain-containing protein [Levilactobacillus tangyuanensis]
MAANEYSESHRIVDHEVDDTRHLTLAQLINLFVLVSEDQNDHLGLGVNFVQSHGVGWVVTQYHFQVTQMPLTGDTVSVKTKATAFNKYFAYREYWLFAADGSTLAYGESIWVAMSYATRKIATIPLEIIAPYETEPVKRLPRLPRPSRFDDSQTTETKPYLVRYFDIDANGHVNNAHYFDWMLDALPADFLRSHQLQDFQIRFENEVRYGESVVSVASHTDTASQHRIMMGATTAATANAVWAERER